jgi:transcription elongation factor GreA
MTSVNSGRTTLSGPARDKLEAELAGLRERREELASEVAGLDRVGDLADNADALRLEADITVFDNRIRALTDLLASGRGTTGLPDGTKATLRFSDGSVQTLQVVAVTEEIPTGQEDTTITAGSPLGLALVKRRSGETVRYPTPSGEVEAEIVSLELP